MIESYKKNFNDNHALCFRLVDNIYCWWTPSSSWNYCFFVCTWLYLLSPGSQGSSQHIYFFYFSLYTTSFRWSSSICILLITMYIMMESKSILRPHSWISDLWVKTTIGHCYLDRHKTYHTYFIKIELLQLLITLITTTIHTQLLLFLPKEWHHCPSSWGENMYKLDITFISNSYFISKSCQYYYFNTS